MNSTEKKEWESLVKKYLSRTISKPELDRLLALAEKNDADEFDEPMLEAWEALKINQPDTHSNTDEKFAELMNKAATLTQHQTAPVKRKNYIWMAAAVVAAFLISATIYHLYFSKQISEPSVVVNNTQTPIDVAPGKDGAILKLANGQEIILDSAGNGVLAMQGETSVVNENGQIKYKNGDPNNNEILFNEISTPRGRQFRVVLSDGTKVWLNAASSIRYPAAFSEKERKVYITGEVYFEVAAAYNKQKTRIPFLVDVTTAGKKAAEVEVLGTHFNINAYDNEQEIKTTLIEGVVTLSNSEHQTGKLIPGQQAKMNRQGSFTVDNNVNTDEVLAWKNGFFSFRNTDLGTLFRQIERWYDITIEHQGTLPDRRFGGEISRDNNISQILTILEESNLKFKMDDKKIIVLP